jgi:hypothetical protein
MERPASPWGIKNRHYAQLTTADDGDDDDDEEEEEEANKTGNVRITLCVLTRSRNHGCRWKPVSVKYYERVALFLP